MDTATQVQLPQEATETFQLMQRRAEPCAQPLDTASFLLVRDVWDFDNVGVSKQIPQQLVTGSHDTIEFQWEKTAWTVERCEKYLICAECDRGPIGMVCQVKSAQDSTTVYLLNLSSLSY